MKYIITERQSRLLEEPEKILKIPSLKYFNNDWNFLQKFLENRGNPPYSISGDLNLRNSSIKSLGNLIRVGDYLDLNRSSIKSLGNLEYVGRSLDLNSSLIKYLGNLEYVGGYLDLYDTQIESLGNLEYVGGNLFLQYTPLSRTMSEDEIRSKVNVEGNIYL